MNENYINMTNLNQPLMNRPSIVPLSKVKGSIYEESEIDLDDSEDMEDHQKKYQQETPQKNIRGIEWYEMVWNGREWYGMAWNDME